MKEGKLNKEEKQIELQKYRDLVLATLDYYIDIFKSYFQRIDKVIVKGKITTDNQFYDINMMVDQLCQTEPVDNKRIEILNRLLSEYEQRKTKSRVGKGEFHP